MIVKNNCNCDHGNPEKKGKKLTLDRGPSGQIDRDENLNFIKFDCQVKMHKSFQ